MANRRESFLLSEKGLLPWGTTPKWGSQAEKVGGGGATTLSRGYGTDDNGTFLS